MARFVLRRLLLMLLVLFAMTFVTFTLSQVLPGDPARTAAGKTASPEQIAIVRERLGLNRPLVVQYVKYLQRLAKGDLGTSVVTHQSITSDIARVLPASIELVATAMLINFAIAVPLGVLAAVSPRRTVDRAVRLIVMFGYIPVFWLGLMLQYVFGGKLRWFPLTGRATIGMDIGRTITGFLLVDTALQAKWAAFADVARHLILPAIVLAAGFVAVMARTTRSAMLGTMSQDYITTARAKGISELRVVVRHGLRNALVPIVTILGMQLGWMLGATVLVEQIFGRTGIGSYAVKAVLESDLLAVVGVTLVIATVFVIANFVVDLLYFWLDPVQRTGLLLSAPRGAASRLDVPV